MLEVLLLLNIISARSTNLASAVHLGVSLLPLECSYYRPSLGGAPRAPIVSTNQIPTCSDGSRPCVKKGGVLSCDCPPGRRNH